MNDLTILDFGDASKLSDLKAFIKLNFLYDSAIKIMQTKLDVIEREYELEKGYNPIHNVDVRIKSPKSIVEKLDRKGLSHTVENIRRNLKDVAGVRIVCNYIGDTQKVADMLKRQLDLTVIEEKNYIENPKTNGYRSHHIVFTVLVHFTDKVENVPVEVQIRTIAMDFWATLEHKLRYKKNKKMSYNLQLRLKACAEITNKLDEEMQAINKKLEDFD